MPRTLVSVIIPAFNAEPYLTRSVRSVLDQTHVETEVVIVDDGSQDATPELAARLAAEDGRVRVLRFAHNRGPSTARNAGLDAAHGEWVSLLDADDAMAPERLERLLELANAHTADMVSDNLLLVPEHDGETAPMIPPSALSTPVPLSLEEFIDRNANDSREERVNYGFMKPMIRSEFLTGHRMRYDESLRFAEDFTLYVRCLLHGAVWWVRPEPMYLYTVRSNSLTQQQSAADLRRLRDNDRSLLSDARQAGDNRLAQVILRHLSILDRDYAYRAFTDALKGHDLKLALAVVAEHPSYAWLILKEACRQAPVIAQKAVSGGYR